MIEKILSKDKQVIIKNIDNSILEYKIIGFVNINLAKLIKEKIVFAIRTTGTKKIITNVSEMKIISEDAQKYNEKELIPAWHKLGIKYNAIVMSSHIFGKLSTEKITEEYKKSKAETGFITKMFDNHELALEWIAKQQ